MSAREYCAKVADRKLAADKRPPRNLGLEAMCEALDGRRIVHHHTRRHDDVLTVLRLAREFDLRVVLNHVIEASLVACEIAEAGAMASIIRIDSHCGKFEAMYLLPDNGLRLAQAGVLFS